MTLKTLDFTIENEDSFTIVDGITVHSAKSFLNLNAPIEWLVPGLIHKSSVALLVAQPKRGKTTFEMGLSVALSTGTPFLERSVIKSRVLFIALEGGDSSLLKTANDMKLVPGADFHIVTSIDFQGKNPMDVLLLLLDNISPDVVFIDTLFKMTPFSENNYREANAVLGPYCKIAKQRNICILLTHHSPKGSEGNSDGIVGSVGIFGAIDTKLRLYLSGGVTHLSVEQRNAESEEDLPIFIDRKEGIIRLTEPPLVGADLRIREDILKYLETENDFVPYSLLKEKIGGNNQIRIDMLKDLCTEGILEKMSLKGKGRPVAYRLKLSQPHTISTPLLGATDRDIQYTATDLLEV